MEKKHRYMHEDVIQYICTYRGPSELLANWHTGNLVVATHLENLENSSTTTATTSSVTLVFLNTHYALETSFLQHLVPD